MRVRYYVDGEAEASVDYPLFLAHATGPAQTTGTDVMPGDQPGTNRTLIGPWGNQLFGRTHDSGWYNVRLPPPPPPPPFLSLLS